MMQKMRRRLGNQQLMKKGLVPRGTLGDGPWNKVAGDLSAWYKRICPFRENDKRQSSQKSGSEEWYLEVLRKERLAVSP